MHLIKSLIAVLLIAHSLTVPAQSFEPFKFVALGDMPYNIPADYVRYERLISQINRSQPSFSIFIGDTKSGSTECSDANNQITKAYFNQFNAPLIYSIGDNEWTDCHRPLAGSYDPIERLQALRSLFFSTSKSLGKQSLDLIRQSDIDPKHKLYVENSYWVKNHFLFVNLHIPGSNNNFERDERSREEYRERNSANLAWIKHLYSIAASEKYRGIIFAYQADMFYTASQATDINSGYKDTLLALSQGAIALKKPVLLVHGDSHRLIIDQPLKAPDQKQILENVLRLEVMGAEQVGAVEVLVDPKSQQPFSFKPILLRENMNLLKP